MNINLRAVLFTLLLLPAFSMAQQTGYAIKAKVEGFTDKNAHLSYYLGNKTYIKQTAERGADGWINFTGNEKLPAGLYMVVLPPENIFFEIIVDENNQQIVLETKKSDLIGNMKVKDAGDNKVFFSYLIYLSARQKKVTAWEKQIDEATDEKVKAALKDSLLKLDKDLLNYQQNLIKKNPDALIAKFTKANMNLSGIPNFSGPDSETKRRNWYRTHWFDNIDMADPRFLYTKLQFDQVDFFVNKLTVQQPDSIINAIDKVLGLVRPANETFKFYTVYFLNTYAKSNIVGMDAVYVHLAKTYYATGQTPWIENESLQKIVENANRIEPLLIGKKAPDIMLPNFEAKTVRLHEQKSPYSIVYFWKTTDDKAQLQAMVKAYHDNKAKGLFVYAVCMSNDAEACKQSILVNGMDVFTHVYDADNKGVYPLLYDIKTTPQLYVLDVSKIIRSKKIKAEQLKDVFASMGWSANP